MLADGSVIRTGGRTVKDVMGYDLTHLFIGSEGTLGIVTEATLRLLPKPAPKLTMLAFFATVTDAGEAVAGMTRAGLVPVTLELMDRFTIRAVDAALHVGLPEAGAMLMIESDSGGQAAEAELDAAARASEAAGALSVVRSADAAEADWLREARRKAHWSLEQAGVARMEDVGVPRQRAPELLAAIERISAEHRMRVGVFGHAGDGNYHPTFVMDRDDPDAAARIDAVRADIFAAVLALGGTISGEHGTGVAKRGYLVQQRGDAPWRSCVRSRRRSIRWASSTRARCFEARAGASVLVRICAVLMRRRHNQQKRRLEQVHGHDDQRGDDRQRRADEPAGGGRERTDADEDQPHRTHQAAGAAVRAQPVGAPQQHHHADDRRCDAEQDPSRERRRQHGRQ